ncbi:MAG: YbjN domain-containing protein [Brevundimonas sp.]
MIHRRLVALLATATLLTAPAAALASTPQTPAPTPPVAAAPVPGGLPISAVRDWLIGVGANVSEVTRQNDQAWLTVTDGSVTWLLFFYSCQADVCGDIQFTAAFSNDSITLDKVNQWNQEHRFLKAYFTPADTGGTAIVQYDVLLVPGAGTAQLADPTAVWVGLLPDFGILVGFFAAPPAAAPAASAP